MTRAFPDGAFLAGALSAGALSAGALSAGALPAEALPAEALPAEALPAEALPAGALPFAELAERFAIVLLSSRKLLFPANLSLAHRMLILTISRSSTRLPHRQVVASNYQNAAVANLKARLAAGRQPRTLPDRQHCPRRANRVHRSPRPGGCRKRLRDCPAGGILTEVAFGGNAASSRRAWQSPNGIEFTSIRRTICRLWHVGFGRAYVGQSEESHDGATVNRSALFVLVWRDQ